MSDRFRPLSLDHVALWIADRAPLASFLCERLGMHVIEETDTFTLVGVDARLGKLTLFDAEGPRVPGVLERIVLRVGDLDDALVRLAVEVERDEAEIRFEAPEGVPMGLVQRAGVDYDLDHVVLRVPDAGGSAAALAAMGFERRDGTVAVGDRHVRLVEGGPGDDGRPRLNHLALLVESAQEIQRNAAAAGFEIDDVKDAPNTLAVFLRGPAGVRIEYVEHKPGFALV
jgi:catechol 2,3-dioxygenase-like lactoylglutathione lyase family enzyme